MNNEIIFLNRKEIIKLGGDNPKTYLDLIKNLFILHSKGKCILPKESYLRFGSYKTEETKGRFIAMPGYIGKNFDIVGLKWISSHPRNQKYFNLPRAIGLIILNNSITGLPICIMEGGLISVMRTAAVTTIAIDYLAKKDFKNISIIGLGVIAKANIKFFNFKKYKFDEIKVFDKSKINMLKFKKDIEKKYGYFIKVEKNAKSAIENSDIILTATTTTIPYVKKDWISEGSLFCNISLFDPKDEVILNSDKIIVDDWNIANSENRPLNRLVNNGLLLENKIYAELGEIITGKKKGRINNKEKIFFNPMGLAIEDLIIAYTIYKMAKEKRIGTKILLGNLWSGYY